MAIGLYTPKPRDILTKVVPINRTDSGTVKAALPKDAVIVGVFVNQMTNAVTGAGSFSLGFPGATTALVSAFSMPTTRVGFVAVGASAGSAVGTKLTADQQVISTYTAGTSTAGGEGYVVIQYFVPGGNETIYD